MATRDPIEAALSKARREKLNRDKIQAHLELADATYKRAVLASVRVGASKAQCGRALGLSEVRVRQIVAQAENNGKV